MSHGIPYTYVAPNFHVLKFSWFMLKVNICDKICVNLPKFLELLVPSTLTSSSTSHAFCEEIFIDKIFVIREKFIGNFKTMEIWSCTVAQFSIQLYMYSCINTSHIHCIYVICFLITENSEINSMDLDTLLVIITSLLLTIVSSCYGTDDDNCTSMYIHMCVRILHYV